MTITHTAQLEIPVDCRFVSTARNFVADAARTAGWVDDEQLDDLRLVVSETVTNALRAQMFVGRDELIRVSAAVSSDRIEVVVVDSAGGFEPPDDAPVVPEPDLRREGGFGLPLIEALTDEVHFTATDDGTAVRLVVYRGGQFG